MSTTGNAIGNLAASLNEFESLVSSLNDEQMAVQSLCPDWDVKGAILHVVGIEHIMIDWLPERDGEAPPFAAIAGFVGDHADDDASQVADISAATFAKRKANLAELSEADLARPCMTPVGHATYGHFLGFRNFDVWVHARDITTPLGLASDDSGSAAEAALDQVHTSLGYIVGKKIGLPEGMSITFDLSGPVTRQMHVAVDGRAKVVPDLEQPASVEVTADSQTFMQLACGRIDPQQPIDDGRISWSGDPEWGEQAARNLAFTM